MKTILLSIQKKWLDMIISGEKKFEFRKMNFINVNPGDKFLLLESKGIKKKRLRNSNIDCASCDMLGGSQCDECKYYVGYEGTGLIRAEFVVGRVINNTIEKWADIEEYEGLYQVSTFGNVKSLTRTVENQYSAYEINDRLLKSSKDGDGYKKVNLYKHGICTVKKVHRLVAKAFIPNPKSLPIINHIDNIPSNNLWTNIEWCSYRYNMEQSYVNGKNDCKSITIQKGEILKNFDRVQLCVDWLKEQGFEKAKGISIHRVLRGERSSLYGFDIWENSNKKSHIKNYWENQGFDMQPLAFEITQLKVYDTPRDKRELYSIKALKEGAMKYYQDKEVVNSLSLQELYNLVRNIEKSDIEKPKLARVIRSPQSFMYVIDSIIT